VKIERKLGNMKKKEGIGGFARNEMDAF